MARLAEYLKYHFLSYDMQDIDPGYDLLRYVCERFELNTEQRFWLAFLYATCYCAANVFYIYNEFPDYENVDVGRLQRWWERNRDKVVFQTDRRWIRSNNQFVALFESYRDAIGSQRYGSQELKFLDLTNSLTPTQSYDACYDYFSRVKYFGRFSLFLYLEAVQVVTGVGIEPTGLPLQEAQSSCNGLCYALGRDDWLRGHDYPQTGPINYRMLDYEYQLLIGGMRKLRPNARIDAWNVETTLCAYKKYKRGKRYPGYYLDRQELEIRKMQLFVPNGVDWSVLYDFRAESLRREFLTEFGAHNEEQAVDRLYTYSLDRGLESIL